MARSVNDSSVIFPAVVDVPELDLLTVPAFVAEVRRFVLPLTELLLLSFAVVPETVLVPTDFVAPELLSLDTDVGSADVSPALERYILVGADENPEAALDVPAPPEEESLRPSIPNCESLSSCIDLEPFEKSLPS